jgi:hypothetical protein
MGTSLRACVSTNRKIFTSGVCFYLFTSSVWFYKLGTLHFGRVSTNRNPSLRAYVSKSSFRACGSTSRELFTSGVYYIQMETVHFRRVFLKHGKTQLRMCFYKA